MIFLIQKTKKLAGNRWSEGVLCTVQNSFTLTLGLLFLPNIIHSLSLTLLKEIDVFFRTNHKLYTRPYCVQNKQPLAFDLSLETSYITLVYEYSLS